MLERLLAHRRLLGVVGSYYVISVVVGAASGNRQTVFYAVLLPVLVALVAYLDLQKPLSPFVLWGLVLWGGLHMLGGLVPMPGDRVLYNVWLLPFLRFDQLVHAIGFGFAGLAFGESMAGGGRVRPALVLMGGLGLGALNEMIEFLMSRVVEETNIGDFENTGWDLVANTVGATVAALWTRSQQERRPR
jgi:hypothetical protein